MKHTNYENTVLSSICEYWNTSYDLKGWEATHAYIKGVWEMLLYCGGNETLDITDIGMLRDVAFSHILDSV